MFLLFLLVKIFDYSEFLIELYDQFWFFSDSKFLIDFLKDKLEFEFMDFMKISEDLVIVNWECYQDFEIFFDLNNVKQFVLVFKGDVYVGLGVEDFFEEDFKFVQI